MPVQAQCLSVAEMFQVICVTVFRGAIPAFTEYFKQ